MIARIRFADPSVPEVIGKVEYVNKELDSTSRSIIVRASFKAPSGKLILPEMQLLTILETQTTQALSIPDAAVMKDDAGKSFFYYSTGKDKEGKMIFKQADLETTLQANGFYSLREEYADKTIVIKGVNILYGESKRAEAD